MTIKFGKFTGTAASLCLLAALSASAVEAPSDSTSQHRSFASRLTLGGYGEVAYSRNFYSDNVNRYSHASDYSDAPGHGRIDLPHVVIMLGYDFGHGWSMGSEIEFEHGGVESAVELEQEEVGEFEQEIERGGEVALEQFWLQKSFMPQLAVRVGHQVVPVGSVNAHHLPTEFFTVYRPEGESQIFPCTWHATSLSVRGRAGAWSYEAMLLPALNSCLFSKDAWVNGGSASPFEFHPANHWAGAFRLDNYSVPGLRLGISGYAGNSFNNTLQADKGKYKDVKGTVLIGTFDFTYQGHGLILRGNFDYGHLSDAQKISEYNRALASSSPYKRTFVGKHALAAGAEAGFDIFSLIPSLRGGRQNLYVFTRYEYYDAYAPASSGAPSYSWTERHRLAAGINYYPMRQIVLKAEFSERFLHSAYNNEPSVSVGVAYCGYFLKSK